MESLQTLMRPDTQNFQTLFLNDTPLLDVRAAVEFSRGAFPNTTNLPLLDDQQRHEIGLCYKQQGQPAAIALGHQLVSGTVREQRIQQWQQWCLDHPNGYLYCFRGGLRSQTVQQWLNNAGITLPLLIGGYKAMRRFLINVLEETCRSYPFTVICGRTGCGKTRVIQTVSGSVDLEGAAHHRGSAFGRRPGGQPAQIDFENRVAIDLLKIKTSHAPSVIAEDEGRLIGRSCLPPILLKTLGTANRVIIDEPLDSRVQVTLEDYVIGPLQEYQVWYGEAEAQQKLAEELTAALARIKKRLGGDRHKQLNTALQAALNATNDIHLHSQWIAPLLRDYYDPMYDYMMSNRESQVLFQGPRTAVQEFLQQSQRP